MRRVVFICLLVAALAMPALASDVTLSGWARYGIIMDSSTQAFKDAEYARLYAKFAVDDYTFAELRFFNAAQGIVTAVDFTTPEATSTTIDNTYLYYGYFSTDLAGYLGLKDSGVTLIVRGGKVDHSDSNFDSVTAYGQSAGAASIGSDWILSGTLGMTGVANLEYGVDPLGTNNFYLSANTTQGPVSFEASYDGNSAASVGKGIVCTTASYTLALSDLSLKLGAGLNYNLDSTALNYDVGLKATYGSLGNVAAQLLATDAGMDMIAISADVTPVTNVTLRAAAKLDISSDATDMFQGADVAAKFDVGSTDIYLGYLITSVGAGNVFAPTATDNGGLYLKMDLSY